MTALPGLPYPNADPWQDLTPFLVNDWTRRGTAALAYLVDGNSVKLSAGLVIGTSRVIAQGLPQLVSAERPVLAFAQSSTGARPLNVNISPEGQLAIGPAVWDQLDGFNALIIGGEVPR